MAYRYDTDLEFLSTLPSKELDDLVRLLTHDKDGDVRFAEKLTTREGYKKHYPDHQQYWKDIAEEIQCFGGNTLMNAIRGEGVLYKEILCDVCDKLKVNYRKDSATEKIEENLLMKILVDALDKMSPEDINNLAKEMGIDEIDAVAGFNKQALVTAFQTIFRMGGFKSYQLTLIIVNAVFKAIFGRGLTIAGNAALTKMLSILTGPIGWGITAVWTAIDIAGPAFRVTIPAVIQVAYLRKLAQYERGSEMPNDDVNESDDVDFSDAPPILRGILTNLSKLTD